MKLSRKIGLAVFSLVILSVAVVSAPSEKKYSDEGFKWRKAAAKIKGKSFVKHSDIYRLVSKSKGRCRKAGSLKMKKGVSRRGRIIVSLGFFNPRNNQQELRRALSIVSSKCAPLKSKASVRSAYYA